MLNHRLLTYEVATKVSCMESCFQQIPSTESWSLWPVKFPEMLLSGVTHERVHLEKYFYWFSRVNIHLAKECMARYTSPKGELPTEPEPWQHCIQQNATFNRKTVRAYRVLSNHCSTFCLFYNPSLSDYWTDSLQVKCTWSCEEHF